MMSGALHVVGILLLFGTCALALLSLLVGFPGTLLIVAAALVYAWATDFTAVQGSTVGWLALLAIVGEGVEFVAGAVGAAGSRPSRRVTMAALLGGFAGGLVGTPLLFGIGSLLGALAGAFAGAAIAVAAEGATLHTAVKTGLAALRGRLLGFILKTAIAVVMVVVLIAAVL